RTSGYSFITEPKNKFAQYKNTLITSILATPALRKRFISAEYDNKVHWNKVALRNWLHRYSSFEGLLLVRAEMLGGAPGRGTELTAMTFKNVPTASHRNLVSFGKYITMLVTYHKGTAMTGTEKLIPHAFDGVTSDLIIQNLVLARPFAQMAAYICYGHQPDVLKLYDENLFVNNGQLFNSTHVTKIMEESTEAILGIKLGLQSWRQVVIAFRRKHCTGMEELFDFDSQDTVGALQASHSRRTENRIYGLSPDALSGVAEDVLPLFLDASTQWQVAVKAVPGGMLMSYHDCRAIHFDKLCQVGSIKIAHAPSAAAPPPSLDVSQVVGQISNQLLQLLPQLVDRTVQEALQKHLPRPEIPQPPSYIPPGGVLGTSQSPPVLAIDTTVTGDLNPFTLGDDSGLEYADPESTTLPPSSAAPSTFDDYSEPVTPDVPTRDPDSSDSESAVPDVPRPLVPPVTIASLEAQALETLRDVLKKPDATWTSQEQKAAVLACMSPEEGDVCCFIKTGAGKSMLAIIPNNIILQALGRRLME
ncbi:hypothetical protein H0H93_009255, partial [Arthromyces matolae]